MPLDPTGRESSVEMCAAPEGVYEVLVVSVCSPLVLSWKQTSCGLSAGDEPVREAYVKRCAGVLDGPLRYMEYGAVVKVALGGSAYEVTSCGF